jgi:hypothetical protein
VRFLPPRGHHGGKEHLRRVDERVLRDIFLSMRRVADGDAADRLAWVSGLPARVFEDAASPARRWSLHRRVICLCLPTARRPDPGVARVHAGILKILDFPMENWCVPQPGSSWQPRSDSN